MSGICYIKDRSPSKRITLYVHLYNITNIIGLLFRNSVFVKLTPKAHIKWLQFFVMFFYCSTLRSNIAIIRNTPSCANCAVICLLPGQFDWSVNRLCSRQRFQIKTHKLNVRNVRHMGAVFCLTSASRGAYAKHV